MKDYFFNLLEFDQWAGSRLIHAMQNEVEIPQRARELFDHLLATTRVWHSRIIGKMPDTAVWAHFDPENWTQELEHNRRLIYRLLKSTSDADLNKKISYYNMKGIAYETSITDILTHLHVHAGYHQGQIISLIKPILTVAPDIMYITYIREKE